MRKLTLILLLLVACVALAHVAQAAPVCPDGGTVLTVASADQAHAVPLASGNYIGNKNSKKCRLLTCGTLPSEKNRVYFASRDEAVKAGYVPCKNYRP
ncbi:MAG: Ada metal-binding domain-containing protein [bacterium]